MPAHPFSFPNICLLLIAAFLIGYLFFLWRIAKQNTKPEIFKASQKPVVRFASAYACYLIAISVLAGFGFFRVVTMPPRFLFVFLPLLAGVGLLLKAKKSIAMQLLTAVPPVALILIQSFRVLVELLFLRFAKEGLLPEQLSFHGRNYDLLIGVLAVPAGALFLIKNPWARKAGIAFNALGLLSLANIFSIVLLSVPSPFRIYNTFYLPAYFPGVAIVFLASLAVYLHVLSMRQLYPTEDACRSRQRTLSQY